MKEQNIWETPVSHGEILKKIWKHLDLGVIDRKHPFHTPVFATSVNNEANLRTVVLRRFWRKNPRGLAFHSHYGSPKIKEINENQKFRGISTIRRNSFKSKSKALPKSARAAN